MPGRLLRPRERPPTVTLAVSTATHELHVVLGLQWQTVLGADLHVRARRKARAAGATHWVHAGGRAESVGMAWLPPPAFTLGARRAVMHAGAQLFARGMPAGVHVLAWALDDGRYWVAMARDGQVLGNGDVILSNRDEALTVLRNAQMRFGDGLRCLGAAAELCPEAADEDPARRRGVDLSALAAMASAASLLQPVRIALYRLPVPAVALLVVAGAGMAAQAWWRAQDAPIHPAPVSASTQGDASPSQVDTQAAWSQAIARQTEGLLAVTPGGLQRLWTALGSLPAQPRGWTLRRLRCDLSATDWHCVASFRRLSRHALAEGFAHSVPPQWRLDWDTLDSVRAEFAVPAELSAFSFPAGAPATPGLLPAADALQLLRPLLRRVEVGLADPIRLVAPLDAYGVSVPRPAHLDVPVQREVALAGPWRSIVVAATTLADSIAWRRVEIDIQPDAEAGLSASGLMASLYGVSYEKRFDGATHGQPRSGREHEAANQGTWP